MTNSNGPGRHPPPRRNGLPHSIETQGPDATGAMALVASSEYPLALEPDALRGRGASLTPGVARILLVDDEPDNLLALEAVLEPLNQHLVRALSGEEALRRLLSEDFALILLDVRMPGLDGFETARFISARARTRHIPIIFLTGQDGDVDQIATGYAAGAVDYVVKPFRPEILRSKVRVFVELEQERARRISAIEARADAEATVAAVQKLQLISDAALAHLRMDALLPELLERIAALFDAETAGLLLADVGGGTLRLAATHGTEALVDEVVVKVGEGFLGRLAEARAVDALRDADEAARLHHTLADAGVRSVVGTALWVGARLTGVLYLGSSGPDRFGAYDRTLLGLCAGRVSIAIEHARAYEAERRVVEELQRSLLPERLPEVEEVRMAVRYLPAEAAAGVGGDWYDAIELPGRRLGLVIGDVVGHGAPAAAMMGELRNSLRAFASEGHLPDAALTRLEAFTTASHGPQMLATLLFMVFEIDTGSATFASAGHLPPLLLLPDGSASYCEQRVSPPLGVCQQRGFEHSTIHVPDGATLMLFTDGLVERRGEAIDTGLERLRTAVMRASGGVEELCSSVLATTQAGQRSRDDLALLAVRLEPLATSGWTVRMPAAADSVPLIRHRLTRWLDQLGVPEREQFPLALAVTEAAANAVEHAYGPGEHEFEVTVQIEGEDALLRIRDHGRWRPRRRNADRGRGLHLIEQLTDELSVRRGRDGTTVRVRHRLPVTLPE